MTLLHPIPNAPAPACAETLLLLLPRLRRRARALSRSDAMADDLAQDCALKLWVCLQRGEQIEDLEAYAMITLRHLSVSAWRRAPVYEELHEDSATTLPDAMPRLMLRDVCAAIDALPDDQRALLRCVIEGETSPAALARRLCLPKGTVMSRLSRARAALRERLGE